VDAVSGAGHNFRVHSERSVVRIDGSTGADVIDGSTVATVDYHQSGRMTGAVSRIW